MAITRIKNSGIKTGVLKYDSVLGGYPPLMPAPTAADGGTGTTATVTFNTVTGATSYTALSTPGSFTGTGTTSPITVSGLSSGTAYTFQVRAENAVGNGPYSAASNSVTPASPTSFESIATATGTGSSATITFSSISSTYKHLQIRYVGKQSDTSGTVGSTFDIRFNSDTGTNYSRHRLVGDGSSVSAGGSASSSSIEIGVLSASSSSVNNVVGTGIIDIHDYANTSKNKTVRALSGVDGNTQGGQVHIRSGLWMNTNAITSISIIAPGGNNWTTQTSFALYGIRG